MTYAGDTVVNKPDNIPHTLMVKVETSLTSLEWPDNYAARYIYHRDMYIHASKDIDLSWIYVYSSIIWNSSNKKLPKYKSAIEWINYGIFS